MQKKANQQKLNKIRGTDGTSVPLWESVGFKKGVTGRQVEGKM
jgi:hypothetical protein